MSRESNDLTIRKARVQDIRPIHRLLSHYGTQGLLLARPLSEIYDHMRDFSVLAREAPEPQILGTCALKICWEDLAEIRSLAVAEDHQEQGFGLQLVEACIQEARSLGIKRIFTLTYVHGFFSKLGFEEVSKSVLPHKVWTDCLNCLKFPDCDETAMIRKL